MIELRDLPLLNACLNSLSSVFLLTGFWMIKKKQVVIHKRLMIAAVITSGAFLASYLIYHFNVGSVKFTGEGWSRPVYFSFLISHTILAAAVPFLAMITLIRGLRKTFDKHRRIARWTLPVWLYVSVTGVLIYLMLYRLFPSAHI